MGTKICVSGYFDPLHVGHLELFERAKRLSDDAELIVIVNNDHQAKLKKGFSLMNEDDRLKIVSSIKWVDFAILSIDKDLSVKETLKIIKPDIFANGGDRNNSNIPEAEVCKQLGIKIVDGLGNKIRSSSDFIKKLEDEIGKGI